jgi:hypothetical protein
MKKHCVLFELEKIKLWNKRHYVENNTEIMQHVLKMSSGSPVNLRGWKDRHEDDVLFCNFANVPKSQVFQTKYVSYTENGFRYWRQFCPNESWISRCYYIMFICKHNPTQKCKDMGVLWFKLPERNGIAVQNYNIRQTYCKLDSIVPSSHDSAQWVLEDSW